MARFVNMPAFERRCIRSSGVVPLMPTKEYDVGLPGYPRESVSSGSGALPAAYRPVRLGPTPCWRGASTLSLLALFPSRTILSLAGNIAGR